MKYFTKLLVLCMCIYFVDALPAPAPSVSTHGGNRLIQFTESGPAKWLTPNEVDEIIAKHIHFMDITDHPIPQRGPTTNIVPKVVEIPTTIRFQTVVENAISKLNVNRVGQFLTHFSSYFNRHYETESGVESALWLHSQIVETINTNNYWGVSTVRLVQHSWAQPSIIARIIGTNTSEPIVVVGAHLDSITSGATGAAPGADDNGSGSAVVLETFRALVESGFLPMRTIEFHWYAAEEIGLLGSQDIAATYKTNGIEVASVANFDMAGYLIDSKIGFIMDFTDNELTTFLKLVVNTYSQFGWMERTCGYACSDHASWTREGYRASFVHEDGPNPNAHTLRDTIENLDFNNIIQFAKLATGYTIEMAEPRRT